MADNVTLPATGTGTATPVIATDDVTGVHYQIIKTTIGALDSAGSLIVGGSGASTAGVQRMILATDDPAVTSLAIMDDWDSTDACKTVPVQTTITQTITRPANTTAYAVNDALMDTAATSGGDTVTGIGRVSGGSGVISDVIVVFDDDAGTPLQGEIFLLDTAFTNPGDNAVFVLSDAEAKTIVAKIPFALEDIGNQGFFHAQGLSIGYTCVGSANLRSAIRVKNAYTPTANSGVITIRYKVLQA